jgi:hypothetical protein
MNFQPKLRGVRYPPLAVFAGNFREYDNIWLSQLERQTSPHAEKPKHALLNNSENRRPYPRY